MFGVLAIIEILNYQLSWIGDPRAHTLSHSAFKYADKYDILWSICQCAYCIIHFQVIWGPGKFGLKKSSGSDNPPLPRLNILISKNAPSLEQGMDFQILLCLFHISYSLGSSIMLAEEPVVVNPRE